MTTYRSTGHLEFPISAATNAAAPLVTAQNLSFQAGAKIRITGADQLNPDSCPRFRTLITTTQAMSSLPEIEWVDDKGEPVELRQVWMVRLAQDGKSVKFGCSRGTMILIR